MANSPVGTVGVGSTPASYDPSRAMGTASFRFGDRADRTWSATRPGNGVAGGPCRMRCRDGIPTPGRADFIPVNEVENVGKAIGRLPGPIGLAKCRTSHGSGPPAAFGRPASRRSRCVHGGAKPPRWPRPVGETSPNAVVLARDVAGKPVESMSPQPPTPTARYEFTTSRRQKCWERLRRGVASRHPRSGSRRTVAGN